MTDRGPFDLIVRRTLAALWAEAEKVVHGDAVCLYRTCPHTIDMCDLLEAISRIHPPLYEDNGPPAVLAN